MSTTLEDLTDAVSTFGQTATERMDATDAVLADLRGDIAASSGNASRPLGRKTAPDDLGSSTQRAQVHDPVARRSQTHGFGHFGDFAASVRQQVLDAFQMLFVEPEQMRHGQSSCRP